MAILYTPYVQPVETLELEDLSVAPIDTTNKLYVLSGELYFDGSPVGSAGSLTYVPDDPTDWEFAPQVPDNLADATDYIADLLDAIAPTQAPSLTGSSLTLTGAALFSGVLPSGLPSSWYTVALAGATITNLSYDPTYNLTSIQSRAGRNGTPSTYGVITAIYNGTPSVTDIVDLELTLTGQVGKLEVFQNVPFGTGDIWRAMTARIEETAPTEGYNTYAIRRTEGGDETSDPFFIYYDDNAILPTFDTAPDITLTSLGVSKFLSGEQYASTGATFEISSGTGVVDDLFNKVYSPQPVRLQGLTGYTATNFSAAAVTTGTINFNSQANLDEITGQTLSVSGEADYNPTLTVVLRKPNNASAATFNIDFRTATTYGISTYGVVSTATTEGFQDEDRRLIAGTNTPFDSTVALAAGELRVRPGILQSPDNTTRNYERRFTKVSASNGTIVHAGLSASSITPFGSGTDLILVLEGAGPGGTDLYFDAGRPFGSNNGAGTGASPVDSLGARVGSPTGSTTNFSFGTNSTAASGGQYRLIFTFRSTTPSVTSITTS